MTDRQDCPFRHENGNCLCIGGFCLAVNDEICAAIQGAYARGVADAISFVNSAKEIEKVNGIKRAEEGSELGLTDRAKVIEILEKAKMIIEVWVPMFEQYNTPAGIDYAIALLKEKKPVTCAECKYWLPMNRFHQDYHPGRGECELNCWVRDSDWFCADGEAKEDD